MCILRWAELPASRIQASQPTFFATCSESGLLENKTETKSKPENEASDAFCQRLFSFALPLVSVYRRLPIGILIPRGPQDQELKGFAFRTSLVSAKKPCGWLDPVRTKKKLSGLAMFRQIIGNAKLEAQHQLSFP